MSNESKGKLKKYRIDIIVISAILVAALLIVLFMLLTKKEGSVVSVEVDGRVVAEYPLDEDGEFPLNGGTNLLVIEGGRAHIENSSCPDHVCERSGRISHVGETIVCLPNRVTVTVKGDSEGGVDLVS